MFDSIQIRGERVKQARKYRNISQAELAQVLKISQSNLSFIESNRHNTSRETIDDLCEALGVTFDWIRGDSMEGGVPLGEYENLTQLQKEKVSERFIACYERLKKLGIIDSDAAFADGAKIPRSSLSLALAGKNQVPMDWIPFLIELGANGEYLLEGKQPMLATSKSLTVKRPDDVVKNIFALMRSIEHDVALLKDYINQIL